ncbi:MAG: apolipoprotein N-acyltransferase [Halanaerobiaceae bacterium]
MKKILLFISAVMLVLPFSYPELYFLSWFAFLPLLYVIEKSTPREAGLWGWVLGTFLMAGTTYWLYFPVVNHTGLPGPFVILLVSVLFVLLGLFYALWGYVYVFIKSRRGFYPFVFAFSWTGIEYLRYLVLRALPFSFVGYTQVGFNSLLQFAEMGGVFLLSFIIALINGYLFSLIFLKKKKALFSLVIISLLVISGGSFRFYQIQQKEREHISAGIINTVVPQENKWRPENVKENINIITEFSQEAKESQLIVAPETSLTFDILRNSYYREIFDEKIEGLDNYIQVGSQAQGEGGGIYNSSFLIGPGQEVIQRYKKNALVPFGEYIPFENIIKQIIDIRLGSQVPGEEITIFQTNFATWITPICSEILNPDYIRNNVAKAQFIINQSNEAWFEISSLQEQMWTAATFRAVENRRSVLRSGNFAYAGVLLPTGETRFRSSLKEAGINQTRIDLNQQETLYQQMGNIAGLGSLLLILLFLIMKSYRIQLNSN